jgi:hypothetical protein
MPKTAKRLRQKLFEFLLFVLCVGLLALGLWWMSWGGV